jgi:hypothetical protein
MIVPRAYPAGSGVLKLLTGQKYDCSLARHAVNATKYKNCTNKEVLHINHIVMISIISGIRAM